MGLLIALLLTVTLQAPFVEAEAQMLGAPSARTVDVTVRVDGAPVTVIARITDEQGEIGSVALVPRGSDAYGQVITLEAWEDVAITFEYISAEGETHLSSASTLSALGVDVPGLSPPVTEAPEEEDGGVNPWLIAGIAAALGAIVLMGFWSTGGLTDVFRSKPDDWTYAATAGLSDEPSPPPADAADDDNAEDDVVEEEDTDDEDTEDASVGTVD